MTVTNEHPDPVERSAPQQHTATSRRDRIGRMADLLKLSLRLWGTRKCAVGGRTCRPGPARATSEVRSGHVPTGTLGTFRASRPSHPGCERCVSSEACR